MQTGGGSMTRVRGDSVKRQRTRRISAGLQGADEKRTGGGDTSGQKAVAPTDDRGEGKTIKTDTQERGRKRRRQQQRTEHIINQPNQDNNGSGQNKQT